MWLVDYLGEIEMSNAGAIKSALEAVRKVLMEFISIKNLNNLKTFNSNF
jgi:hypothetical protein